PQNTLLVGMRHDVSHIDPVFAWDWQSIQVINQICEGLYEYNLSDPNKVIIPKLATDFGVWNASKLEITIELRQGIKFHDGTDFDANAVKWSFERLKWFIENDPYAAMWEDIYTIRWYPNSFIFEDITIIDSFTIRIKLWDEYFYNFLYDILCSSSAKIIPPNSLPKEKEASIDSDILVGTGPFKLIQAATDHISFEKYNDYYRELPTIQFMDWVYINNQEGLYSAIIDGNLDLIYPLCGKDFKKFSSNTNIKKSNSALSINSIFMSFYSRSSSIFDFELRQALSKSLNYSRILKEVYNNDGERLKSIIPNGIKYANNSFTYPTYQLTEARNILIDNGYANGLSETSLDDDWISRAENDPLLNLKCVIPENSIELSEIAQIIQDDFKKIGIKLEISTLDIVKIMYQTSETDIDLFLFSVPFDQQLFEGFEDDSNDKNSVWLSNTGVLPLISELTPQYYVTSLCSNTSITNFSDINNNFIQCAIWDAATSSNETEKQYLYSEIQREVVEENIWYVPIVQPYRYAIHINMMDNFALDYLNGVNYTEINWQGSDRSEMPDFNKYNITPFDIRNISGFPLVNFIGIISITSIFTIKLIKTSKSKKRKLKEKKTRKNF
ncbi:MAG: ABC transporter substrate-binding protein, partial [Promethearchaeota archaeon]